ncbi:MAG: hypothetical protein ABIA63_03140, partial [bacterium]
GFKSTLEGKQKRHSIEWSGEVFKDLDSKVFDNKLNYEIELGYINKVFTPDMYFKFNKSIWNTFKENNSSAVSADLQHGGLFRFYELLEFNGGMRFQVERYLIANLDFETYYRTIRYELNSVIFSNQSIRQIHITDMLEGLRCGSAAASVIYYQPFYRLDIPGNDICRYSLSARAEVRYSNSTDSDWSRAFTHKTLLLRGDGSYTFDDLLEGYINIYAVGGVGVNELTANRVFRELAFSLGGNEFLKGYPQGFLWGRHMGYGRAAIILPVLRGKHISFRGMQLDRAFLKLEIENGVVTQTGNLGELIWGRSVNLGLTLRTALFYHRVMEQTFWLGVALDSPFGYDKAPMLYWSMKF